MIIIKLIVLFLIQVYRRNNQRLIMFHLQQDHLILHINFNFNHLNDIHHHCLIIIQIY